MWVNHTALSILFLGMNKAQAVGCGIFPRGVRQFQALLQTDLGDFGGSDVEVAGSQSGCKQLVGSALQTFRPLRTGGRFAGPASRAFGF